MALSPHVKISSKNAAKISGHHFGRFWDDLLGCKVAGFWLLYLYLVANTTFTTKFDQHVCLDEDLLESACFWA